MQISTRSLSLSLLLSCIAIVGAEETAPAQASAPAAEKPQARHVGYHDDHKDKASYYGHKDNYYADKYPPSSYYPGSSPYEYGAPAKDAYYYEPKSSYGPPPYYKPSPYGPPPPSPYSNGYYGPPKKCGTCPDGLVGVPSSLIGQVGTGYDGTITCVYKTDAISIHLGFLPGLPPTPPPPNPLPGPPGRRLQPAIPGPPGALVPPPVTDVADLVCQYDAKTGEYIPDNPTLGLSLCPNYLSLPLGPCYFAKGCLSNVRSLPKGLDICLPLPNEKSVNIFDVFIAGGPGPMPGLTVACGYRTKEEKCLCAYTDFPEPPVMPPSPPSPPGVLTDISSTLAPLLPRDLKVCPVCPSAPKPTEVEGLLMGLDRGKICLV